MKSQPLGAVEKRTEVIMTLWQRAPDLPNCQLLMDTVSSDMMLHERQPVSRSVSVVVALPRDCYSLKLLQMQNAADQYYRWTICVC